MKKCKHDLVKLLASVSMGYCNGKIITCPECGQSIRISTFKEAFQKILRRLSFLCFTAHETKPKKCQHDILTFNIIPSVFYLPET